MAARTDDPLDAIGRVVELVPALRFLEDLPRAGRREEVILRRRDQPRLRREQLDVVGLVEAGGNEAGHALLGVAERGSREQRAERIHVARHRRNLDPGIERGDVGGLRAAARTSRGADAIRIDLRTADQVVDRPHAIVDEIARQRLSHEDCRGAVDEMLLDGSADQRPAKAWVISLLALALADRVVGEDDKAPSRQVRGDQLPCRLARLPMPHRHQHRGMTSGAGRTVQIGGDHEARQALEHDVLDHVPVARGGFGDAGVERPAGLGQPADQREHALAHGGVPRLRRSRVLDAGDCCRPRLQLALCDLVERGRRTRAADGAPGAVSGEHGQQSDRQLRSFRLRRP